MHVQKTGYISIFVTLYMSLLHIVTKLSICCILRKTCHKKLVDPSFFLEDAHFFVKCPFRHNHMVGKSKFSSNSEKSKNFSHFLGALKWLILQNFKYRHMTPHFALFFNEFYKFKLNFEKPENFSHF